MTEYDVIHNADIDELAAILAKFIWWNPTKEQVHEWLQQEAGTWTKKEKRR